MVLRVLAPVERRVLPSAIVESLRGWWLRLRICIMMVRARHTGRWWRWWSIVIGWVAITLGHEAFFDILLTELTMHGRF